MNVTPRFAAAVGGRKLDGSISVRNIELLSGASEVIDREQEDKERAEWALGDYDNGDDGCPHCKRMRLCKCENGMHRCEKCNWCPELNGYAPYSD